MHGITSLMTSLRIMLSTLKSLWGPNGIGNQTANTANQFKLKVGYPLSFFAIQAPSLPIKSTSAKRKIGASMTGSKKTPSTSPSKKLSSPPEVKLRHRFAKRQIRRRRVDLACGCSIYININCSNYGFTHRGTHHCSSSNEWRFYMGASKSPIFQNNACGDANVHKQQGVSHSGQSKPQHAESAGSPQSLLQLPSLDDVDDDFWADLLK
uniref:Transcriptional activator protein n=1 Tax=Pepper huasteco yellow vein virus TaxID=223303 RepID=A0A0F7YD81_PHUV|nr:Transcriptional activator protein [Pepper huasteco yellow vein virus]CRI68620.1 Transcriptional activator protein [Pepper huasteco yellow vein virus]CRI68624.1 Transcriptional activator protein [Pepper huasteco yellow vein virus]